jgi:SAM-dependent methyltransferase
VRVDLGTSPPLPEGQFDKYVNLAAVPEIPPGKMVVADLTERWPFDDSSVDYFRAHDIIEHLPDKIFTLNELHRCLKPDGSVEIFVPVVQGVGAYCDPTHVSYWSRKSFDYFLSGTAEHNRFARQYGITAKFSMGLEERRRSLHSYLSGQEIVEHLLFTMRAVKP